MDNVQKETHVVSVMTHKCKETCTVVGDEKDDRLLPHQIRRPRLTKGRKILKNIRQQRGKLFRQEERNPCRDKNCQNLWTVHFTRHFLLCTTSVLNNVLHNTLAQVSARARHFICMVIHVVRLSVLRLSVPHLVLFRVFLQSFFLLPGH